MEGRTAGPWGAPAWPDVRLLASLDVRVALAGAGLQRSPARVEGLWVGRALGRKGQAPGRRGGLRLRMSLQGSGQVASVGNAAWRG